MRGAPNRWEVGAVESTASANPWQALRAGPSTPRTIARWLGLAPLFVALAASPGAVFAWAADKPAEYRSEHFFLTMDGPPAQAEKLLQELEGMVVWLSDWCGQPCNGVIACYVVVDKAAWPQESLPESAWQAIGVGGGTTLSQTARQGNSFAAQSRVYCVFEGGVCKHEAVHAYCRQTFGEVGPLWFSEGLAEMGQYWLPESTAVHCEEAIAEYLRQTARPPLEEILATTQESPEMYGWFWTLCHFLSHHPRTKDRFKQFGRDALAGNNPDLKERFAEDWDWIAAQHAEFVRGVRPGLELAALVEAAESPATPLASKERREITVMANVDWQPSGIQVTAGERLSFRTKGRWQLVQKGKRYSAEGGPQGEGRLQGVLMLETGLGTPFDLGKSGKYEVPSTGKLFLRCFDPTQNLGDNSGQITATFWRID